jgi:aminoglycoside phosphotransferase (APT) family kinase protein
VRPLHGDPHVGNLLVLDGRPAWTDFEDCGLGPVQWDLVCLLRARGEVDARELAAYGQDVDPDSLAPFVEAGMIRGAAWLSLLAASDLGYRRDRDERLAWLAAREREAEAS